MSDASIATHARRDATLMSETPLKRARQRRTATSSSKDRSASARRASRAVSRRASAASSCSSRARTIRFSSASIATRAPPRSRHSSSSCSSVRASSRTCSQQDLFETVRVADYLLDKDRLFARLTLDEEEYALYEQVYARLSIDAPAPDLVVYLQAPVDVLLERIARRGIDYEQQHRAPLSRAAGRGLRALLPRVPGRAAADRQRRRDRSRSATNAITSGCCAEISRARARPPLLQPAQEPAVGAPLMFAGPLGHSCRRIGRSMYTQLQLRDSSRPPVNVATLGKMKANGEKIACLTAYDASFAALIDEAGIDVVLVGDSLGMVIQGHDTTVPVTLEHIIYHCRAVAKGLYPPVPDGRHAVHDLHVARAGAAERRAADAGRRRQDGQARRRRGPGRDRRVSRASRHRRCARTSD